MSIANDRRLVVRYWETGVPVATLDLDQAKRHRAAFGFFRDRRPDLYGRLTEDI
jgi:N-carbamoylputrescine amidase